MQSKPFDKHLAAFFKENKGLRQESKQLIANKSYQLLREKIYLDYLCKGQGGWEERQKMQKSDKYKDNKKNMSIGGDIRYSVPPFLWDMLTSQYSQERVESMCSQMLVPPPLTLRIHPSLTSRSELKKTFWEKYQLQVDYTKDSNIGLTVTRNDHYQSVYETDEYQKGLVDIQDQASQLAAMEVECTPGQQVLDYCAGAGGKALVMTMRMKNEGQIYLHDINKRALDRARVRMARAGVRNA